MLVLQTVAEDKKKKSAVHFIFLKTYIINC